MIRGTTTLIAHFGDPIAPVKAPMIYNPYFESAGIDAVVVPMGVRAADYPVTLKAVFRFTNIRGALVTMPHKVTTVGLLDDCSTTVKVAGSCNAILRRDDGTLHGDLFDGAGFVRGVERKGFPLRGARCLVVGTGGVGSAIAAALAAAGVGTIALYDNNAEGRDGLAKRLRQHYPSLEVRTDTRDPSGFDLVVNGTPLGMNAADPLPVDVSRLSPKTFVGEVVMKQEITPLLRAARERGCMTQIGTDMLFEQIPLYLEFFGYGQVTAEELRAVAMLT
ncbi:MAG: ThiF family adenylyltransferase [Casimicrobiaceae bacterium]